MLQTSEYYKKAIKRPNREIRCRATIGDLILDDNDILSFTIEEGITSEEDFSLGSVPSSYMELTLNNAHKKFNGITFENKEISLEIGIVLFIPSRDIEYVPMGTFIIEEASKPLSTITIKGFDRMILFEKPYVTNLSFPTTLLEIVKDIGNKAGVTLATLDFPNKVYIVAEKPILEDTTLRQAISYVASLSGSNARINRSGELELVWLEDTDIIINKSNYIKFTKADSPIDTITKVIIQTGEEIAERGTGEASITIKDNIFCQNPYLAVDQIFNRVNGLAYHAYSGTWQGDPSVLPGSKITINDGVNTYNTIITNQKIIYNGGLKTDIQAIGRSNTAKQYDTKGNVLIAINKTRSELKVVKDEISTKVSNDEYESFVQQTVSQIQSKVSYLEYESYKIQTATEISQRVVKGNIISEINQTAETIKIQAAKIDLSGYATFSSLINSGQTVINGDNILTGKVRAQFIDVDNLVAKKVDVGITITAPTIIGGTIKGEEFQVGANIALRPPNFIYGGGSGELRLYKTESTYATLKYGAPMYNTFVTLSDNFRVNGLLSCTSITCDNAPWSTIYHTHSEFNAINSEFTGIGNQLNGIYGMIANLQSRVSALGG